MNSIALLSGTFCFLLILMTVARDASVVKEEACVAASMELELPVELKTRGKPKRAKWEQLDRVMINLSDSVGDSFCRFKFSEVFVTKRSNLYLPVTNNLIRLVPEASLQGLPVFESSGEQLGKYAGRSTYERTGNLHFKKSYKLHYFQFKDFSGELQSAGRGLLLDNYLVRWNDLKSRVAIDTLK